MSEPKRLQRRRTKGWRKPPGAVNVTRPSDWSNPFRVGDVVEAWGSGAAVTIDAPLAVALFVAMHDTPGMRAQIRRELEGADIMCYCPVGAPCHGDWLLDVANGESP